MSVTLATLAAYAIARLDFPGKKLILSAALAIAIFPVVSLVGPLFDMWRTIGLFDTWLGLIIPYMSFTLPLVDLDAVGLLPADPLGDGAGRRRSTAPRRGRPSAR